MYWEANNLSKQHADTSVMEEKQTSYRIIEKEFYNNTVHLIGEPVWSNKEQIFFLSLQTPLI